MPLVSSREMLDRAQKERYAIGAFNIENMEMAQAVVWAAEAQKSPVIIQTTSSTLKYADPDIFFGMVSQLAQKAAVPVALHLDHGNGFDIAKKAIEAGYTSIMIDGSLLPYEQNIELTKSVVEIAGDIPVEAELGTVGGKEDDHEAKNAQYTDPLQAKDFIKKTKIASFAVAIGTAHGVYKGEPQLDIERLSAIRQLIEIPLVLHGTSGVPHETVRECISKGICKVNYATELRIAFSNGVKEALKEAPDAFDPKYYLSKGRENVMALTESLILVCGSAGKA